MSFELDCSDAETGMFEMADIELFRLNSTGEEESRIEHWIKILPESRLVYTVEVEYHPNVHRKTPLPIAQYQIKADNSLQIAEANGGKEARLKIENNCTITVLLPSVHGGGWEIFYRCEDPKGVWKTPFLIAIDPRTGQFKVLK